MIARTLLIGLAALPAFLIGLTPASPGGEACRAAAPAVYETDEGGEGSARREIFFAVLEGLYTDGVDNETVDKVAAIDDITHYPANFVYACPICMPAFDAFRTYRARPEFYGLKGRSDTFGEGLSRDVKIKLASPDLHERQGAVRELIEGWIRRHMDRLRLTDEERARWTQLMAEMRKQGMFYLEQYRSSNLGGSYGQMKECPFCEAANGACRKR